MNGTTNEFQTDQHQRTLAPTPRHFSKGWTRRINLNPMAVGCATNRQSSGIRRRLAITSFSATMFAVHWKLPKEADGATAT